VELLNSEDINFEQYLKLTEAHMKVKDVSVFIDELKEDLANPVVIKKVGMPWSKTINEFEFKSGEVTLYAGSNGGGKSLITGQIALSLIKQDQKVCIMSFEMKPKRTIMRMTRQFSGTDLDNLFLKNKLEINNQYLERLKKFSTGKLWLYDQQGTTSTSQVISVARYCAVELGITHIFIDSLMKCVAGEDDYNAQKSFVDELTALARDHNVHIHLVHHIRKLESEEKLPNKNDVKGTGAIADQVDNVLLMWRNKQKERMLRDGKEIIGVAADAILMCEKQRNGENENSYQLWYHKDSQQFVEDENAVPMAFDTVGSF
jgi:twinkle protein